VDCRARTLSFADTATLPTQVSPVEPWCATISYGALLPKEDDDRYLLTIFETAQGIQDPGLRELVHSYSEIFPELLKFFHKHCTCNGNEGYEYGRRFYWDKENTNTSILHPPPLKASIRLKAL